jgi:hypothetical protein
MDTTSSGFKNTVRGVMRTQPGQVLIHGLDWALDKSENLLRRIRPRDRSPRKRKVTRSSLQKVLRFYFTLLMQILIAKKT